MFAQQRLPLRRKGRLPIEQVEPVARRCLGAVRRGRAARQHDVHHLEIKAILLRLIGQQRACPVDPDTGPRKRFKRRFQRFAHARIHRGARQCGDRQQAAVLEGLGAAAQRHLGADFGEHRQIGSVAGKRPGHAERAVVRSDEAIAAAHRRVIVAVLGDEAPGRLVPPHPAEMRGHPYRTADVGAIIARDHPARHSGRAAAR
jgi:hypothetical protein